MNSLNWSLKSSRKRGVWILLAFIHLNVLFKWTFVQEKNKNSSSDAQPLRLNVNSLATYFIYIYTTIATAIVAFAKCGSPFSFFLGIIYLGLIFISFVIISTVCFFLFTFCPLRVNARALYCIAQEWYRKRLKSDELALIERRGKEKEKNLLLEAVTRMRPFQM